MRDCQKNFPVGAKKSQWTLWESFDHLYVRLCDITAFNNRRLDLTARQISCRPSYLKLVFPYFLCILLSYSSQCVNSCCKVTPGLSGTVLFSLQVRVSACSEYVCMFKCECWIPKHYEKQHEIGKVRVVYAAFFSLTCLYRFIIQLLVTSLCTVKLNHRMIFHEFALLTSCHCCQLLFMK